MLKVLLLMIHFLVTCAKKQDLDPIADQLIIFKEQTQGSVHFMTTSSGALIESKDAGSTLNTNLLKNEYFKETLTHLVRERTPVRTVHPKAAGAFGYFITTRDISDKCRADFLNGVGKVTPVAVRLSMSFTERGGSDLIREPRGFSVKFYTEEGNFDIAGFNTPMAIIKDPTTFTHLVHALRKNPVNDFTDINATWDYLTLHPESLFVFLILFSDKGIPDGYRHMSGYSIHTYPLYNASGKITYVRFQFYPVNGMKTLNSTEAASRGAADPDYSARDLYKAIANGDYPTWDVNLQIMSEEQVKRATFSVFDISKPIPESHVPWQKIGSIVLNRLPSNYFADVEQLAFCPCNLVRGVLTPPDKTSEARSFFYKDAQRYRLGSNFDKISVNFPYKSKPHTYNRDGSPPINNNQDGTPSYYPNSFNGPVAYKDKHRPNNPEIHETEPNNFAEMRDYYENQIIGEERNRLVENMLVSLSKAAGFLQDRAVKILTKIHQDLGNRVAKRLRENNR